MTTDDDIKALKAELALLKLQFSQRIDDVESRLDSALNEDTNVFTNSIESAAEELSSSSEVILTPELSDTSDTPADINPWTENRARYKNKEIKPAEDVQPSIFSVMLQALLGMLFEWLSPVVQIYKTYKDKGTLGTFVLTLVGLALTLSGFGYLMQLLIEQLGAGSKSLLMSVAAIVVSGLGIGLKLKTRFSEFATAIVVLGILLSYSTVYFAGSVYGILPESSLLLLYLLIALLCHILAFWLDAKIVSGLGIIGVATMPILSNSVLLEPLYYLLSLAFISASSLVMAYKRQEHWLANLTLVFCVVALEWTISSGPFLIYPWLITLFYLLFFVYIVSILVKNESSFKQTLLLLAALLGSIILIFFQANDVFSNSVSTMFVVHSAFAVLTGFFFYWIRHKLTQLMVFVSVLWAALAVISAVSNAYWGIAWAIEGLLLLYLGRNYEMRSVVGQGQVLTALALVYCLIGVSAYFPVPALISIDGWIMSIVIVLAIGIWQRLIDTTGRFNNFTKTKLKPTLQLIEVVWTTVLLIATAEILWGSWAGTGVIAIQFAWLLRAKQCKNTSIEVFAASLILVSLYCAYQGALLADSYRFMTLPLFAKVSLISAFLQLWLWSEFYKRCNPYSALARFAENTRLLFYVLLPVIWLGSALRRLDEDILVVLWIAPLIALILANRIKHSLLIKEAKLLSALASIAMVAVIGFLDFTFGLFSIGGYILFFGLSYYLENGKKESNLGKFTMSCAMFSLAFAVPIFCGAQTSSFATCGVVSSLIWVSYLLLLDKMPILKHHQKIIISINAILLIISWILISQNIWFILSPLIFLIASLIKRRALIRESELASLLGSNSDLFLHSVLAITYVCFFAAMEVGIVNLLIAPSLAVHGALVLFMKDRRLATVKYSFALIALGIIKLALIDAANAQLWQKVILFMGIGIFILFASFWYQKLVGQPEDDPNTMITKQKAEP